MAGFFKSLIYCALISSCVFAEAQSRESFEQYKERQKAQFEKYSKDRARDFEEYRRLQNESFADYMRKAWRSISVKPEIPKPKDDDVKPYVAPRPAPGPRPAPRPIPFDEVVPLPNPLPRPEPFVPIPEVAPGPETPVMSRVTFKFYGIEVKVRVDKDKMFHLSRADIDAVSDCWLTLSSLDFSNMIVDCLDIRDRLKLGDWAYLMLLRRLGENVCGPGTNESILLMAYIYCQSGYQMRLAFDENYRLHMLYASQHTVYERNYFSFGNINYYMMADNAQGRLMFCNTSFPGEKPLSLLLSETPEFVMNKVASPVHSSRRDKDLSISVAANQNRLDFYSEYPTSMVGHNPVSRWAMYANLPMPRDISDSLYPKLRGFLAGMDNVTALNKLLNLIQTGFVYEFDDKIWGHDRAFFPEETLHYPYCDCEDRAILLTRLVRDVLGLKCMLVYYPGHLAAAIHVDGPEVNGDYIDYKDTRYYIADPTICGYGAPVGTTMKGMDNSTAKVILLD